MALQMAVSKLWNFGFEIKKLKTCYFLSTSNIFWNFQKWKILDPSRSYKIIVPKCKVSTEYIRLKTNMSLSAYNPKIIAQRFSCHPLVFLESRNSTQEVRVTYAIVSSRLGIEWVYNYIHRNPHSRHHTVNQEADRGLLAAVGGPVWFSLELEAQRHPTRGCGGAACG